MIGDRVHLFIGPTISAAAARTILPGVMVHPPVGQGDVLRLLHDRPSAIGIVDGLAPAVWHKEILVALASAVPVFGASSIGALRAAELHQFGMVGVGRIFEWYRDGVLQDDDEVALVHASVDDGHRALSHALVDLRDLYERARVAEVIDSAMRDDLVAIARRLHYRDRHHRRVMQEAFTTTPVLASTMRALDEFVAASGPGLQERDAFALLEFLVQSETNSAPRPPSLRVEPTVLLHQLHNETSLQLAARTMPLPDERTPLRGLDSRAVLSKKVLTRLLARRVAKLEAMPIDDHDVGQALWRFRSDLDLTDDDDFDTWCDTEGVTTQALLEFFRDTAIIAKLERAHHGDIDGMVADQLRITTARTRGASDPSGR